MIDWFFRHAVQLIARVGATLIACVTLQHIIQTEGYRCELRTLLIGAALAIVTLRLWMPWSRDT